MARTPARLVRIDLNRDSDRTLVLFPAPISPSCSSSFSMSPFPSPGERARCLPADRPRAGERPGGLPDAGADRHEGADRLTSARLSGGRPVAGFGHRPSAFSPPAAIRAC